MFLLIPPHSRHLPVVFSLFTFQYVSINTDLVNCEEAPKILFTFQYVSINTDVRAGVLELLKYLHSNMFLLIHPVLSAGGSGAQTFTFQYVSINTCYNNMITNYQKKFTFQYVSINTKCPCSCITVDGEIYIPICFY